MKKSIITILAVFAVFLFVPSIYAQPSIMPIDGHYEGPTSQGGSVTFDIVDGKFQSIHWSLSPNCVGRMWGFYSSGATYYGDYFTHSWDVVQDVDGYPIGIEPGVSNANFVFGKFDTTTHATGGIWHAMAYFTGNDLKTNSCLDTKVTFEVDYTGPVTAEDLNKSSDRRTIVELD